MEDRYHSLNDSTSSLSLEYISPVWQPSLEWESITEYHWQALLTRRAITENATLLHVSQSDSSAVYVEPSVTYRDIVGLRASAAVGSVPYRALSALALIESSDGYWLLFERDSGDWPHSFECPGGFVRAAHRFASVEEYIVGCLNREVSELTIQKQWCIGYFDFASILEQMYVFRVQVKESAAQVRATYGASVLMLSSAEVPTYTSGTTQARLPLHFPSQKALATVRSMMIGTALSDTVQLKTSPAT